MLGRLGFVRLVSVRLGKVRPTRSDDWKSDKLVDRPCERVVDVDDEGVGVLCDVTLRHVEQVTELLIGQISFWSGDVLVRVIDDLEISFYYVIHSLKFKFIQNQNIFFLCGFLKILYLIYLSTAFNNSFFHNVLTKSFVMLIF